MSIPRKAIKFCTDGTVVLGSDVTVNHIAPTDADGRKVWEFEWRPADPQSVDDAMAAVARMGVSTADLVAATEFISAALLRTTRS